MLDLFTVEFSLFFLLNTFGHWLYLAFAFFCAQFRHDFLKGTFEGFDFTSFLGLIVGCDKCISLFSLNINTVTFSD